MNERSLFLLSPPELFFFHFFVLSNSDVLVFVLFYSILLYYCHLEVCFLIRDRKGGAVGTKEGGRWGDHEGDMLRKKNLFLIKGKGGSWGQSNAQETGALWW